MSLIKQLDPSTILQIAAGEVIERPASALRELLDNALDAGAENIDIVLEKGGKSFISVADDGKGMDEADIKLSPKLHTTSKINTINDLNNLHTFGFRGEALASLAEVSTLTIASRQAVSEHGYEYSLAFGQESPIKPKGMNKGTSVVIENLFQNLPARLKFLGADTGEYRACLGEFLKKALAYPQIGFKLSHNNETSYNLAPASELFCRILDIFPNTPLQAFHYQQDDILVYGFCSPPSWYRPTRSHQYFFVNNRAIEWAPLRGQIAAAYGNLLPPGKFPACFIYVQLQPSFADFNVHPQKKEIRFQNERLISDCVRRAIRDGINLTAVSPTESSFSTSQASPVQQEPSVKREPKPFLYLPQKVYPSSGQKKQEAPSFQKSYRIEKQANLFVKTSSTEHTLSLAQKLLYARQAGQIFHTYLIFDEGLQVTLVDFHALHERIRYEKLLVQKNIGIEQRNLLIPQSFVFPKVDADLLEKNAEAFNFLGFSLTRIGETEFSTDTLPVFLDSSQAEVILLDLFHLMEDSPSFNDSSLWDRACKSIACKGSVKSGDKLSAVEVEALLQQWHELGCPQSCPHGRPIAVSWEKTFFDKAFKRLGF